MLIMKRISRLFKKRSEKYNPEDFFEAVSTGDYKLVKAIADSNIDVNSTLHSRTPLYISVCKNHVEITEFLLAKGADVNQPSGNHIGLPEEPPLIAASRLNFDDIVRVLVKTPGLKINCVDTWGSGALYYAVRNNSVEIVTLLLNCNAAVNAGKHVTDFPIYYYYKEDFKDQIDIIHLLLEHGCTNEHLSYYRISSPRILYFALQSENVKTIQLLLRTGFRGNEKENMHLLRDCRKLNEELYMWLLNILKNPTSLKSITRVEIRKTLAQYWGNLRKEYINRLPVPDKLKDYLWLQY